MKRRIGVQDLKKTAAGAAGERRALLLSLTLHFVLAIIVLLAMHNFKFDHKTTANAVIMAKIIEPKAAAPDAKKSQKTAKKSSNQPKRMAEPTAEKKTKQDQQSANKRQKQLKQEQLKQEQLKQEQLKQEQLKQEQLKQEQLKQEQLKQEQLKQEQLKQEQLKQEQLKQEQLKQEQLKQAQAHSEAKAAYVSQLQRHISSYWYKPATASADMQCDTIIQQSPSGYILQVEVVNCKGGADFRQSVIDAIWRAEPLPQPQDKAAFERDIQFIFIADD